MLHPIPPGTRPFQIINVNHLGPFETSTTKNKYLFVVADNLTKYVLLYPCRTTDAASVIKILTKFCNERGMPDRIISDRGTSFTARSFEKFCTNHGIAHTLNSTRHPQANGQVERANRTILPLLSLTADSHDYWDRRVPEVERMLNTAVNKTTNKTPYEALHGHLPRFQQNALHTLSCTKNERQVPSEVQAEVRQAILKKQEDMKKTYDK